MARKVLNVEEELINNQIAELNNDTLTTLASEYIDCKEEAKPLNDKIDAIGNKIKDMLDKHSDDDKFVVVGDKQVVLSYRMKDVWDEEKMIELLKNKNLVGNIVKTKEYIDFDELERAIYNESLPKDVMKKLNSYKTSTVASRVLNIKKVKKEK